MTAPTVTYDSARRPGALGLIAEGLREVWARRRLIRYLVRADLKKTGSDTLLGNLWWIIDPLLQMCVYVVLVTMIFDRKVEAYPLFVFCAILPWSWFQTVVNQSVVSVTGSERLIKQLQFPKIILPISVVVAGIANFLFGLVPLFGLLLLVYPQRFSPLILWVPVIAVVQFVFSIAIAIGLAAINVFFRDIGNIARHALKIWFYLSPALYDLNQVTATMKNPVARDILLLNPFSPILESYRNVIYGNSLPMFGHLLGVLIFSLVLLGLTTLFFKRVEPTFAKVL